jgi:hypothetical protein
VSDLERLLRQVDPLEVFPATPALDAAVEIRVLRATAGRRRRRPWLLAAVAAALVTFVAAIAAPGARTSFLDWLRIGGVGIERRALPPPAAVRGGSLPGMPVSLAEARSAASFAVLVPEELGEPDAVLLQRSPDVMVTLVYGSLDEPRVILSQWRSEALRYLKILPYSARVERIGPPEAPSFWISAAHALGYQRLGGGGAQEPFRLSAPALVWIRGELTYRLEGRVSRGRALEIARSLDGQ